MFSDNFFALYSDYLSVFLQINTKIAYYSAQDTLKGLIFSFWHRKTRHLDTSYLQISWSIVASCQYLHDKYTITVKLLQ